MTNLCTRFIVNAAERLAQDQRIPAEARQAFRDTAASVLHQQLLALLPDRMADSGCLRFYPARSLSVHREERDQRIQALLVSGMSAEQAAADTGCSRAHAYRIRARVLRKARSSQIAP
jgi:hypothetical protein